MRRLLMIFAAIGIFAANAGASAQTPTANDRRISYWSGVVCDSEPEVRRYGELRRFDTPFEAIVKMEEESPGRCKFDHIWFFRDSVEIERIQTERSIFRTIVIDVQLIGMPGSAKRVKEPMKRYIFIAQPVVLV